MTQQNLGFVFPGQGSQQIGMLSDIAEQNPEITQTFAEASEVLGYDLWDLMQNGDQESINQTEVTQPLLLSASVSLWRLWQAHEGDKYSGMQTGQELDAQMTRLNRNILKLIDDAFDPNRDTHPQAVSHSSGSSVETPPSQNKKKGWWDYVVAAGVIVAILGGLAEFLNYINIVPNKGEPAASRSVSILAHTKEGKDQLVLPGRGIVELHYGEAKMEKPLNKQGEAFFQEIPARFFEPDAKVEILFRDPEGEPYRASYPDSLYKLTPGKKYPYK